MGGDKYCQEYISFGVVGQKVKKLIFSKTINFHKPNSPV